LRALFEALTLLSRATNRIEAARRSQRHLDDIRHTMLEFERQASSADEIAINEANHEFHLAVARAADSSFLEKAYQDVLVESLRLSSQCFLDGEGPKDAHDPIWRKSSLTTALCTNRSDAGIPRKQIMWPIATPSFFEKGLRVSYF
jgi:DNA-binding GntR family transcriptional regulator